MARKRIKIDTIALGQKRAAEGTQNFNRWLASDDPRAVEIRESQIEGVRGNSIRALFEKLTGIDADDPSAPARIRELVAKTKRDFAETGLSRSGAITSGAFHYIIGNLNVTLFDRGMAEVATPLADNVFRVFSSKKNREEHGAAGDNADMKFIGEGQEYPTFQVGERWYVTNAYKAGRRADLTIEMIRNDEGGKFLERLQKLGQIAAYTKEKLCAYALADSALSILGASVYAYYPEGTRVALYRTTAGSTKANYEKTVNKKTSNALADYTDVQNARGLFRAMTDDEGRRWGMNLGGTPVVIVPRTLEDAATKAVLLTGLIDRNASDNQTVWNGPAWLAGTKVIVSDLLDTISTSTWYYGFPAGGAFKWHSVREPFTEVAEYNDRSITHDVVLAVKAGLHGGAGCIDDRYMVQSTA